jgi:hypothetical protein
VVLHVMTFGVWCSVFSDLFEYARWRYRLSPNFGVILKIQFRWWLFALFGMDDRKIKILTDGIQTGLKFRIVKLIYQKMKNQNTQASELFISTKEAHYFRKFKVVPQSSDLIKSFKFTLENDLYIYNGSLGILSFLGLFDFSSFYCHCFLLYWYWRIFERSLCSNWKGY